ncbi:hypothetical protein V1517DRAFT_339650 [Lipomyces orientalis]|uniref:Uncharacterized protein n=1 Tax=Lipomyces orientalis TaxID=1233043 RepID=A0ACC3TK48_9ASCO
MRYQDTVLPVGGGSDGRSPVFVRPGNTVVYSVCVMYRHKEFFGDDSDEFRPELVAEDKTGTWEYLPFSGASEYTWDSGMYLPRLDKTIVRRLQEVDALKSTGPPEQAAGFT